MFSKPLYYSQWFFDLDVVRFKYILLSLTIKTNSISTIVDSELLRLICKTEQVIPIQVKNSTTRFQYLTVIFFVLILLIVSNDILHSYVHSYSFYLSESMLFGTFWLMFLPILLICQNKSRTKFNSFLPLVLTLCHLGIFSFFVFLISTLFFNHTFEFYRILKDTSSDYGIVCVVIYSIDSFYFFINQASLKEIHHQKISKKIKVTHQNKVIVLDCEDILYVKSEKPYISIVTKDQKYLHHSSLKDFLGKYATNNFMQIHKSSIVNANYVVSYTSRKNGDYDILLANQHLIRASRSYNYSFKPFFDSIS